MVSRYGKHITRLHVTALLGLLAITAQAQTFSLYLEPYMVRNVVLPEQPRLPDQLYNYTQTNSLGINLALVTVSYATPDVRGALGLMAGTYAQNNTAAEPTVFQYVFQANAGVRLGGSWWVDAGVLPSHIGLESPVGMDNMTLTRSQTADNSPYYETGVRVSTVFDSALYVAAFVLNGWQNMVPSTSVWLTQPSTGWQVTWFPSRTFSLNSSSFIGEALRQSGQSTGFYYASLRLFHDLHATLTLGDVDLSAELHTGWQEDLYEGGITGDTDDDGDLTADTWYGVCVHGRWRIDPTWRIVGRVERFSDPGQTLVPLPFAKVPYAVNGASVGVDAAVSQHALVRFEARYLGGDDGTMSVLYETATSHMIILTTALCIRF
jgi:hypothetical protein